MPPLSRISSNDDAVLVMFTFIGAVVIDIGCIPKERLGRTAIASPGCHSAEIVRAISVCTTFGSQLKQEDPLNLSILLSGGKETNQDSLSKGD